MYLKDCSWLIRLMMLSLICMTIYSSCKLTCISFWFKFRSKNLYSISQSWVSSVFLRVEHKHLISLALNYGWKNNHYFSSLHIVYFFDAQYFIYRGSVRLSGAWFSLYICVVTGFILWLMCCRFCWDALKHLNLVFLFCWLYPLFFIQNKLCYDILSWHDSERW